MAPNEFYPNLLLTRKEAAAYKGLSGESSLRDAESRGLASVTDDRGRTLYTKAALDEWKVKSKEPTEAKKRSVLNGAQKARCHEAQERARRMEAEEEKEQAEHDAWRATLTANDDAEAALRAQVRAKNTERERLFRAGTLNETEIRDLLAIDRTAFRKLERTRVIRRVEPPNELVVKGGFGDPVTEGEGSSMYLSGGPFYLRADALALRRETVAVVREDMPEAPHGVVKDIAGVLLHAFASESEAKSAPTKSLEEMFAEAYKAHGLKFPGR